MCASLPAQIVALHPETALVTTGQASFAVGRQLAPEAQPGDWVLVNAGQIVSQITPEEAAAIRELLREIMTFDFEANPSAAAASHPSRAPGRGTAGCAGRSAR